MSSHKTHKQFKFKDRNKVSQKSGKPKIFTEILQIHFY